MHTFLKNNGPLKSIVGYCSAFMAIVNDLSTKSPNYPYDRPYRAIASHTESDRVYWTPSPVYLVSNLTLTPQYRPFQGVFKIADIEIHRMIITGSP